MPVAESGEIYDFTKMQPGDLTAKGEILRACPKCGRTGLVFDCGRTRLHLTVHIGRFATPERQGAIIEACHLDPGSQP